MVGQHCTYDVVMVGMVWSTFIILFANGVGWGARIQLLRPQFKMACLRMKFYNGGAR